MKPFDVLTWIDLKIVDRLEKFCKKTQRTIGWTNFTFAYVALGMGTLLGVPLLLSGVTLFPPPLEYCLRACASTLLFAYGYYCTKKLEKKALALATKGLRGGGRLPNETFRRVFFWFFFVTEVGGVVGKILFQGHSDPVRVIGALIFLWSILLWEYCIACDPDKPCDSKLKQWLQSLFLAPAPIRNRD